MRLHVAADDRTGAFEVAAALADRGVGDAEGVPVSVWPETVAGEVTVIDLASRHLPASEAASRAASLAVDGPAAHKIDSTLRGNWASEVVARHHVTGLPVLLVPALPALGRVCRDGVVLVDGTPVHAGAAGADARRGVDSSRPADHLRSAGAERVVELGAPHDVAAWLRSPAGFAVADAAVDDDLAAIAVEWSVSREVLLAGTSAAIAAVGGASSAPLARVAAGPVLVVLGSLNPVARTQIGLASERGAAVVEDNDQAVRCLRSGADVIVTTPTPERALGPSDADRAAGELAARATAIITAVPEVGAIVVIGGDTTAALLGDGPVRVLGSLTPGTAWVESPELAPPIITRAGGFGDERWLADLLSGTLRP